MIRTLFAAMLAFTLAAPPAAAIAPQTASPDEAKALAEQAHDLIKDQGAETAFAAFADADGSYRDRDLYVFCMDLEGEMLVHPLEPDLVGRNLIEFDQYGDALFRDMIAQVKEAGEGWIKYRWPHPGSDEIRDKTTYVIGHEDGFFCGVGAYR
ncbi:cache domain-containing protein [Marichromatium bheemlicum]|uniref:Histidine kinase n=1 Tax=Marichromatium bheemlicum TaxID=365339 RepID=A0ABX1ICK8_9GAMM|nr:cache domain-containing protein [Marichromatium bheemlicum]NKN34090.1 histidine kinase [Marichromatium bheemlicum]